MALKLIPPGKRKNKFHSGRSTDLGEYIEESTKKTDRSLALVHLRQVELRIEAKVKAGTGPVTFAYPR